MQVTPYFWNLGGTWFKKTEFPVRNQYKNYWNSNPHLMSKVDVTTSLSLKTVKLSLFGRGYCNSMILTVHLKLTKRAEFNTKEKPQSS